MNYPMQAKAKKRKKSGNSCNKILAMDQFQEKFEMSIDYDGSKAKQSTLGFVLSIILFIFVLIFFLQKIEILNERSSVVIIQTENKNKLNDQDIFEFEDGFYVAAAFTGYNNVEEYELPWEIGELNFYVMDWGPTESGGLYDRSEYLETSVCTPEELGLEGDNASFFPLDKVSKPVVSLYRKKFLCI